MLVKSPVEREVLHEGRTGGLLKIKAKDTTDRMV